MTFKEFKRGIKAIPFSTWKKIAVPIICVFIAPLYVLTTVEKEITLSTFFNLYLILVVPIVLGLYILRWISDFLSD